MPIVSHRCIVAPRVCKVKTFKGLPSNRQEELELDHGEAMNMTSVITEVSIPIRSEHNDNLVLGSCREAKLLPDGRWDARLDFTDTTPEGREAIRAIEAGELREVSLKHRMGPPAVPLEISLCKKGAREGAGIYFDKATQLYTSSRDPSSTIAASQTDTDPFDETQLYILRIVAATAMPEPAIVPDDQLTERKESDPPPVEPPPQESDESVKQNFPTTTAVSDILSNVHGIPSKAQREAIKEHVADLEIEKKEKQAELEEKQAEIERLQKELEAAKAGPPPKDANEDIVDQMVDAFEVDAEAKKVLASATPEVKRAIAALGRGVARTYVDHEVVKDASAIKMQQWQERQRNKLAPVKTPATTTTTPTTTTNGTMFRRQVPVAASSAIVPSYAPTTYGPKCPGWGQPKARMPTNVNLHTSGIVLASQASQNPMSWERNEDRDAEPGAGLNFDHSFMQSEGQAAIYKQCPRDISELKHGLNVCLADQAPTCASAHRQLKREYETRTAEEKQMFGHQAMKEYIESHHVKRPKARSAAASRSVAW